MLFSLSHGTRIVRDAAVPPSADPAPRGAGAATRAAVLESPAAAMSRLDLRPLDAVVDAAPRTRSRRAWATDTAAGAFRYLFRDAPGLPESPATLAALDRLAESMATETPGDGDAAIPPIYTYFGQFIDHDITANTDREVTGLSEIVGDIAPVDRTRVERDLDNLRDGSLGLDSLYGDSPDQGDFALKLAGLMRHPTFTDKMRLGLTADSGDGRPPLPADPAADLLRLGFLMDQGDITQAELDNLDAPLRENFVDAAGQPIRSRAIIGDGRNDENLLVAQLHVAFLRLHNRFVDLGHDFGGARELTRFHYQWLVLNDFLPVICAGDVVDEVLATGAPLYAEFMAANPPADPDKMPMPLEFSVAGFRFGHSMVRGGYDHNRFFGRAVAGSTQLLPFADFRLLFGFTGGGRMRPAPDAAPGTNLPGNWVIEWDRFVHAETPLRSARKIDTHLTPRLNEMVNQLARPGTPEMMQRLAMRNLRRGYRLNMPSAQSLIAAINATGLYRPIPVLSPTQVADGRAFLADAGLDAATPLWFYVLREAETVGGHHLGALGSHLVANTLIGLVVSDPASYWNARIDGHRWSPQLFRPSGPVDSLKAMLRFTGLLA